MEITCHLVSLLFVTSKMRQHGNHTLPCFSSFQQCQRQGGMESTYCLISPPSSSVEDKAVWSPHAASFLPFRRQGGVESTCHLVPSPSCNVEDEAAWHPHTVLFPLLPAVSKTRWHEIHMLPCFSSCSINLVSFLSH